MSSSLSLYLLSVFRIYIFSLYAFVFLVADRLAEPSYNELLYCKFVSDVKCINFKSLYKPLLCGNK